MNWLVPRVVVGPSGQEGQAQRIRSLPWLQTSQLDVERLQLVRGALVTWKISVRPRCSANTTVFPRADAKLLKSHKSANMWDSLSLDVPLRVQRSSSFVVWSIHGRT
jgi:hypothetical protein